MVEPLYLFTLYRRPLDYPNSLVLRRFRVIGGKVEAEALPAAVGPDTPEGRATIAALDCVAGLAWLERQPEDDRPIVGTWV